MTCLCLANHRRLYYHHHHHRQHLQIHWNSSNQLFHSSGFVTVSLGDLIDFLCPHYLSSSIDMEYNTLYLVNENDYYYCNTTDYTPLIRCDRPLDRQPFIYTLSISKYLPYPNLPEFDDGQFYYFISTSSGQLETIDEHSNGLCQTKNMKLILNVQKASQHWPRPIIAKRTNLTFIDPWKRFDALSFLTSSTTSRNISLILRLLMFSLLTKSRL